MHLLRRRLCLLDEDHLKSVREFFSLFLLSISVFLTLYTLHIVMFRSFSDDLLEVFDSIGTSDHDKSLKASPTAASSSAVAEGTVIYF